MLKILSICVTLLFLLVSSAMAQSGVGACAADIKKVCANIEPGNLRIATCVKEHLADVPNVGASRKWLASGMPSPISATIARSQ